MRGVCVLLLTLLLSLSAPVSAKWSDSYGDGAEDAGDATGDSGEAAGDDGAGEEGDGGDFAVRVPREECMP